MKTVVLLPVLGQCPSHVAFEIDIEVKTEVAGISLIQSTAELDLLDHLFMISSSD